MATALHRHELEIIKNDMHTIWDNGFASKIHRIKSGFFFFLSKWTWLFPFAICIFPSQSLTVYNFYNSMTVGWIFFPSFQNDSSFVCACVFLFIFFFFSLSLSFLCSTTIFRNDDFSMDFARIITIQNQIFAFASRIKKNTIKTHWCHPFWIRYFERIKVENLRNGKKAESE